MAGPYNAQAVGAAEDVEVLIDVDRRRRVAGRGGRRSAARSWPCASATPSSTPPTPRSSNLDVAGEGAARRRRSTTSSTRSLPGLDPLAPVIDFEQNVVTPTSGDGLAVDALVVSVLEARRRRAPLVHGRGSATPRSATSPAVATSRSAPTPPTTTVTASSTLTTPAATPTATRTTPTATTPTTTTRTTSAGVPGRHRQRR